MKLNTMSRLVVSLAIAPLSLVGAEKVSVTIDTEETGAPINPYIYGQFIEHLGRCIYGGIWAEMLEDRKFYFPITADYAPYKSLTDTDFPVVGASPWQIIGDADLVQMTEENSFVGKQTPLIKQGAGIRQLDLGVREGIDYNGYVWGKPVGSGPAEVEVTFIWGEGEDDRAAGTLTFAAGDYSKHGFSFKSGRTIEKGASIEVRAVKGDVLIGTLSLMPGDNVRGMRADTLELLKKLDGTIYRWPGGNFVSGYNWRDGIGDRDRRPPRKNPAWTGVEHNDFGTDEFIDFCREIGTEPMIAANTGLGDAFSAGQWVEYCNSGSDTIAGGWRAKNGNAVPYNVKYWCVGNEMFGTWQLGFMQLQHYVIKHNEVAEAMWEIDPNVVLVGVGDLEGVNTQHDPNQVERGVTWSEGMLQMSGDHMDMISEHFYVGRTPWSEVGQVDLSEHVVAVKNAIRVKAEGHRKLQASLPNLDGRIIPIAMDEWNYWHRNYEYGELGCVYDLSDGLGIAEGLHEFFRQSDIVEMAHYAQTVNVIGAIKTTRIAAEMETTGLILQMYRAHYGTIPMKIADTFAPYDVTAALTEDGRTLTVAVVNPTKSEVELSLDLGATKGGAATRWHVAGPDAGAHNAPGKPRVVDIERKDGVAVNKPLPVPALSATIFSIPLK